MTTASDIAQMEFEHYKLQAPWNKIIGEPVNNSSILMFSGPGSGKSTVALQFADQCTLHGKVGYNVQEEGFSATLANKLERLDLLKSNILFFECEHIDELKKYIQKEKLDFVFIDSFTMYDKRLVKFEEFRTWCKKQKCVLVSIVQTTKEGKFYGNADAAFNVDCVLKVTDGKPSTMETGKNRLGELYEHEIDLRNTPVKPVKTAKVIESVDRENPMDESLFCGLECIQNDKDIRENPAISPNELYDSITKSMIELIESGKELPWSKPWRSESGYKAISATNFVSNKAYRGINAVLLNMLKVALNKEGKRVYVLHSYTNPYWFTFKQVEKLGGKIKKGSLGNPAYYFSLLYVYDEKDSKLKFSSTNRVKFVAWLNKNKSKLNLFGSTPEDYADTHYFPMLKYYNLYSGEDVEGIDFSKHLNENTERLPEADRIKAGELIIKHYPGAPEIVNKDNKRAFYRPSDDIINMPEFGLFKSGQEYYSTLFHEAIHSTGHESRLDRLKDGKFGDAAYSFEELIAELGAVLLSAESGTLFKIRDNSAAYLKGWKSRLVKEMKDDNKFFFRASSRAQAAADLILDRNDEGVPAYLYKMVPITPPLGTKKEFLKNPPSILWGSIRVNGATKFGQFRLKNNRYSNKIEYAYFTEKGNRGTGGFTIAKAYELFKNGSLSTKKEDFILDDSIKKSAPQIEQLGLRFNPSGKEDLVYLGIVERLDVAGTNHIYELTGAFFLLSDQKQKRLYVIPPKLVKTISGTLGDAKAERLFSEWHNYKPENKILEITYPSKEKVQKVGTAEKILYISDKIMEEGDRKGENKFYTHDFDTKKRPVSLQGDVIIIDNIDWNYRGILN